VKRKIINDPVHGFIAVKGDFLFEIIDSQWFQRLRRIKQLGLTHLVYPGALHTRFHHAIGAMHLMQQAIDTLRDKGHHVSSEEEEGALLAILLHDIGHGPFSHALEYAIIRGIGHEAISLLMMQRLNSLHQGRLDTAIGIFTGHYHKTFLHQLVTGQLDVDRLDYLKRDSFFTGVSEGVIGTERIIKMLNVEEGRLVIEEKGIYSVEKFLLARRLMYWQVYLHKTVLAADSLLKQVLRRAYDLVHQGVPVFSTPAFRVFLEGRFNEGNDPEELTTRFALIDDFDVIASVKAWIDHSDRVLRQLTTMLMQRSLFRCELRTSPFTEEEQRQLTESVQKRFGYTEEEAGYFVFADVTSNHAYLPDFGPILIQMKDGSVRNLHEVSDQMDFSFYSRMVVKHYICYPKDLLLPA